MGKRQVDVKFNLIDDFTAGFGKAMQTLTAGTKKAEKAWKGVEQAGKNISHVGDVMTAAITAPLVGIGAVATKEFGDVDSTLRLIKQTMGEAKFAAGDLEGAMKTAASNSVFGMKDAADASLNFARQGWDAAQAANMVAPSMALAAGTATDLSVVTGGLGNTLKAFGEDADQATHYTDMMAIAQAQANTNVTSLFDAMSIAGSTAKTVGWTFSDLATLTGVFGDHSIAASEGANALNTGLMRLASPAKQGAVWMDKLKINVFNANGGLKSMPETIGELQKGFKGLSDQEQLAAASAIFGKQQASKWVTLINGPTKDALKGLKDNIDGNTGAAQSMSDALMEGPGGAMQKLGSAFDVFKYSAGSVVATVITPLIEKGTELLNKFNEMDPAMQKQIVKWLAVAAAAGPVIGIFGRTVSLVGHTGAAFTRFAGFAAKAAGGFGKMSSGATMLKGAIAAIASPAGVVIAVIAAIGIVVLSVVTHLDTFKKNLAATGGFEKFKASIEGLKAASAPLMPVLAKIGDFIGNVIAGAAGIAAGAFMTFASHAIDALAGLLQFVGGVISGINKLVHGDLKGALDAFKGAFEGAIKFVKNLFTGLFDTIKSIGKAISSIHLPEWGGFKGIKMNTTEARATGDNNWRGGIVQVHEKGGEILDLPHGTRIYPHDVSMQMAKSTGNKIIDFSKFVESAGLTGTAKTMRAAYVPGLEGLRGFEKNTIEVKAGITTGRGKIIQFPGRDEKKPDMPAKRVYQRDYSSEKGSAGGNTINIPKLADQIIVREDADIDKIGEKLMEKLETAAVAM